MQFPANFFFGSSTAAAQIETAGQHPWRGRIAQDGARFERTTDHELHRAEDAELIAQFGTIYRCSVDWSRLQPEPGGKFDPDVVKEYQDFFDLLGQKGVRLMLVMHHFCHPNWFEKMGGFTREDNIPYFIEYVRQCVKYFGDYADYWNTFNEPNIYAFFGYIAGKFPPGKRLRLITADQVLENMGRAHNIAYTVIRDKYRAAQVGISLNTCLFEGLNWPGALVARLARWWFMDYAAKPFEKSDFIGISYYTWMLFNPLPLDAIHRREALDKRNIPHDDMWAYNPGGLKQILHHFHKKYKKPIIIAENGICTDSDTRRIQAIRDYLTVCHEAIGEGVDLRGYIHWSTWDNFEWHLGPSYRFGLVRVDFNTMARNMTEAGRFYSNIAQTGKV